MPAPRLDSEIPSVLRDQFVAWMQGARSRASGMFQLHENPYPERTLKADAWENGWECIDWDLHE